MNFDRLRSYSAEELVPVAFAEDSKPLIYVREEPEQRFVLFTFSVADSKLMFAPGFPALMSNTLEWLAHVELAEGRVSSGTRRPGPATFAGSLASVVGPDGRQVAVTKIGAVSIATFARPGFYEAASGGARSVIAVNAGDPEVSDLQRTRLPNAARTDAASAPSRGRPWWLLAAALAFVLLAAEWWTWQRRVTV